MNRIRKRKTTGTTRREDARAEAGLKIGYGCKLWQEGKVKEARELFRDGLRLWGSPILFILLILSSSLAFSGCGFIEGVRQSNDNNPPVHYETK